MGDCNSTRLCPKPLITGLTHIPVQVNGVSEQPPFDKQFPKVISLEVGGQLFRVRREHLLNHPETRLGHLANILERVDECRDIFDPSKICCSKSFMMSELSYTSGPVAQTKSPVSGQLCAETAEEGSSIEDSETSQFKKDLQHELLELCDYFNPSLDYFFFDQNTASFAAILNYYRNKELHMPFNQCFRDFQRDLLYWNISLVFAITKLFAILN